MPQMLLLMGPATVPNNKSKARAQAIPREIALTSTLTIVSLTPAIPREMAVMLFIKCHDDKTLVIKDWIASCARNDEGCARNDEGCNESSSFLFSFRVLFLINLSFADGDYTGEYV